MAKFHDQMECINSALEGNQFGIDLSSLIIQGDIPSLYACLLLHSSAQLSTGVRLASRSCRISVCYAMGLIQNLVSCLAISCQHGKLPFETHPN